MVGTDDPPSPVSVLLRDIGFSKSKFATAEDMTSALMRVADDPVRLNRLLNEPARKGGPPAAVGVPELSIINAARQLLFPLDGPSQPSGDSARERTTSLHPEVFVPSDQDIAAALSSACPSEPGNGRKRSACVCLATGAILALLVLGALLL